VLELEPPTIQPVCLLILCLS